MGDNQLSFLPSDIETLFSGGTVILFKCKPTDDFPLEFVSDNVIDILGFDPEYFIENANGWSNRIHPGDKEQVMQQFEEVIENGGGAVNEYRFKRSDGSYIWLRDEYKMIYNDCGVPQAIFGSSFEITGRKKAELALKASKRHYESIVENTKDVIYKIDNRGRWSFLNRTWKNRTGFSPEKSTGKLFLQFIHPDDRKEIEQLFASLIDGSDSSFKKVIRCLTSAEDYFWADMFAKRLQDEASDDIVVTGTLVDVTAELERQVEIENLNTELEDRVRLRSLELEDEIEKRKKAEAKLRQRLAYEKAISKCSNLLLKNGTLQALEKSLRILLDVTSSDRIFLYKNNEAGTESYFELVMEVCAEGIDMAMESQEVKFKHTDVSWWAQQLSDNKIIHATIDDVPEPEKSILAEQKVKSVLVIPVTIDQKWNGYLGFADVTKKRYWQDEEISLLKTIAGIIASYKKRVSMERSLINERNYTQALLDSLPSIYLLMDTQMNLVEWNTNAELQIGYSSEALSDKSAFNLVLDEDHQKMNESLEQVKIQGKGPGTELRIVTKSGEQIPYFWNARQIELDGTKYVLAIGVDITQQKKIERDLIDEKRFNEAIIGSLPGIFYMLDTNGNYLRWNENFSQYLGYSDEEIRQMKPADFFPDKTEISKIAASIEKVYAEGEAETEAVVIAKDGRKIPYHLTGKHFSRNEKDYLVGVGFDISEQKRFEEEINSSLQEKNVLLQEIHHRVKNNLAVITGLIQLQVYEHEDNQVIRETLQECERRIQTMALIHEKLYQSQNLSRISCKSYLGDLVRTIRDTIDTEKEIEVITDIEDVELNINKAVPFALLVNEVITNSFKHAFKGRNQGKVSIDLREMDHRLHVRISDNGIGMGEPIAPGNSGSLGMTLIYNFLEQLEADWDFGTDNGTYLDLLFTQNDMKGSSTTFVDTSKS